VSQGTVRVVRFNEALSVKPDGLTSGQKMPKEALEFFRTEGKRGAKARMTKLTQAQRSEVARKAAAARWGKAKQKGGK
jgi:hypothetical protein